MLMCLCERETRERRCRRRWREWHRAHVVERGRCWRREASWGGVAEAKIVSKRVRPL